MFWYLILASKQNELLGRVAAGTNLKLDTRNKLKGSFEGDAASQETEQSINLESF